MGEGRAAAILPALEPSVGAEDAAFAGKEGHMPGWVLPLMSPGLKSGGSVGRSEIRWPVEFNKG